MGRMYRLFSAAQTDAERKARFVALTTDLAEEIAKHHRSPYGFSLKEAWETCRGLSIPLTASDEDLALHHVFGFESRGLMKDWLENPDNRHRAASGINTSLFPIVTGTTIIKFINDKSQNVDDPNIAVANKLVTEITDEKKTTTIPEGVSQSAWREVAELEEYPERGASESYVTIGRKKFGEQLKISMEAINDDQTPVIMAQAEAIAQEAPRQKARRTIQMVTDCNSGKYGYVYKPAGVGEALYTTSARTGGTNKKTGNVLATEAQLKSVRLLLTAMTDKDAASGEIKRVGAQLRLVLVPEALRDLAMKICGSPYSYASGSTTSTPANELNPYYYLRDGVYSSYVLDESSTTTWYAGDPARQFKRKIAKPFTVERMTSGSPSDEMFSKDIALKVKVSEMFEIGTDDYRFFVQSTS